MPAKLKVMASEFSWLAEYFCQSSNSGHFFSTFQNVKKLKLLGLKIKFKHMVIF